MKKLNRNKLIKGLGLVGGAIAVGALAQSATNRSANVPTGGTTVKNEFDAEAVKELIKKDPVLQNLLRGSTPQNGTNGKDGLITLAKTQTNQNQITYSILSGDAIVVLNQYNKLAPDGMTGMAINQVIRVDTEIETLISFYISPGFSQQNVNYLPTIQDLQGNILTGPGGEFSEMITEAECFSAIGGYIILKVNEGGALEIVQYPTSPTIISHNFFGANSDSINLNSNGIIIIDNYSVNRIVSGNTIQKKIVLSDNVTNFSFFIDNSIIKNANVSLPLVVDSQDNEILFEFGDPYSGVIGYDYSGLTRLIGTFINFKKEPNFWVYNDQIPKIWISENFEKYSEKNIITGSINSVLTINSSVIVKDFVYEIINAKTSGTLTVNFSSVPQSYTTQTSFVIKRPGESTSITPYEVEFKRSMRFMFSSHLNKFVIL